MNEWRIIRDSQRPACLNLAIDEVLLRLCDSGQASRILKFNYFSPPAVILGTNQVASEINLTYIKKNEFDLNRRLTGGGVILIGFPNHTSQIGISFITPLNPEIPSKLSRIFKHFSNILLKSLTDLGLDPFYQRNSDIFVNQKKIIGNGIYMMENAFIFHSVILYDFVPAAIVDLLNTSPNVDRQVLLKKIKASHTSLRTEVHSEVTTKDVEDLIIKNMESTWNITTHDKPLTETELTMARSLNDQKYATSEWILQEDKDLSQFGSCFI
ncbi:MAG: lipoate--protein ligase family protein [Candidatus Helarchaeota archaeon]